MTAEGLFRKSPRPTGRPRQQGCHPEPQTGTAGCGVRTVLVRSMAHQMPPTAAHHPAHLHTQAQALAANRRGHPALDRAAQRHHRPRIGRSRRLQQGLHRPCVAARLVHIPAITRPSHPCRALRCPCSHRARRLETQRRLPCVRMVLQTAAFDSALQPRPTQMFWPAPRPRSAMRPHRFSRLLVRVPPWGRLLGVHQQWRLHWLPLARASACRRQRRGLLLSRESLQWLDHRCQHPQ